MDTRTDEDLAAGVARGSRDDLEAVVERHHRPLIGFLYIRVGGDIRLAEDLAQETFVRVMRGIGTYRRRARSSRGCTRLPPISRTIMSRARTRGARARNWMPKSPRPTTLWG